MSKDSSRANTSWREWLIGITVGYIQEQKLIYLGYRFT